MSGSATRTTNAATAGASQDRILVIALSGIGDVLCALPLIEELRLNFPAREIDAAVMWPGARDLLAQHPAVNRVFQLNLLKASYPRSLSFCLQLRRRRYATSVNVYPQSKFAYRLVAWLVGARMRISHRYENHHFLDRFFITHELPPDRHRHVVDNNLDLLRFLGASVQKENHDYGLALTGDNRAFAERFIAEHGLADNLVVGVHVGSGTTKNLRLKRWPLEHYRELIGLIIARHPDARILLFGGPEEAQENRRLKQDVSSPKLLCVETPAITDAAAIIGHCRVFVSVDSALMHLAAATKVPHQIVIPSAAYTPSVAPYGRPYRLISAEKPASISYAFDGRGIQGDPADILRYMTSIRPGTVYEAMAGELKRLSFSQTAPRNAQR